MSHHLAGRHVEVKRPAPPTSRPVPIGRRLVPLALAGGALLVALSSPPASAVKQRGHPVRGAIAGLFFGLFVSLDLVIFGVLALDADILAVIPILALAVVLGLMAPLRKGRGVAKAAVMPKPKTGTSAA